MFNRSMYKAHPSSSHFLSTVAGRTAKSVALASQRGPAIHWSERMSPSTHKKHLIVGFLCVFKLTLSINLKFYLQSIWVLNVLFIG